MTAHPELLEVTGTGLLPLMARVSAEPLRLLVKSGRVGGEEAQQGSLAITPAQREAALAAASSPGAEWERDPDFDIDILVSEVDGVEQGLLVPRFLYRRADRIYEYAAEVPTVQRELAAILTQAA